MRAVGVNIKFYVIKYFVADQRFVNQESLHGVAGGGIVGLGVHHDLDSLVQVTVLVKVGVADTIGVTQHWDGLGSLLDGSDKFIRASRDDQVDIVVQLEEV